jgi:hypothetical protein
MAKELESIRIVPAENGGHTVRHAYKPERNNSRKNGLTSEYVPDDEYVFGASEHGKMMAHVTKALGCSGKDKDEE